MDNDEVYTVGQVCEILGAPKHFVSKILNNGLIRGVKRKRNCYRVLSAEQLELVRELYYLGRSGAGIRDLKKYANLAQSDEDSMLERKAILETKRRQMWEELKNIQENIDFIERKIEIIDRGQKI